MMHYFMLAGAWPKHTQLGPSTLSNCQQTMKVINENKKKGNKGYRPHYLKSVVTRKQSVSVEYSNNMMVYRRIHNSPGTGSTPYSTLHHSNIQKIPTSEISLSNH